MSNNIDRDDLDELIKYLQQNDPKLTHGPKVEAFENSWSEWLEVKHSVMVNSGSSANDLNMLALREMYGTGEVIVPGLTWVSDIASVLHANFKPIFVDINRKTLGLDTDAILRAITPKTKAVFITHILGFNALTDKLISELSRLNIKLIEDVCESHGATHNGKKLGSFGWSSNFSFYYAHHLTTIEGGMISTNDSELFDLARTLRSHGLLRESFNDSKKQRFVAEYPDLNPEFIFTTYAHNMRPTEINGILGSSQLRKLDSNNKIRTNNLKTFLSVIDPEIFQTEFEVSGSSNYALTLILKQASFEMQHKVESILKNEGIEFRRGLSGGGNQLRQPYLKNFAWAPKPETLPNTDFVHHFGWYIGNYPKLSTEKIEHLGVVLKKLSSR